ncbi:Ectoine TRAP transporter large permease protein TeaC [Moorella humiferrea]|uniref:TRAP transporter large permease n=1 Tax=Neomoorella humiferrea TaxID=676965 RepID=UPI0030CC5F27
MLWALLLAILLFIGFPFLLNIIGTLMLYLKINLPMLDPKILVQQIVTGISPPALVCVPLYILGAEIIIHGETGKKLARMIMTWLGHLPGGIPVSSSVACTIFGAVSGSAQATLAAIGGTFRPILLRAGYPSQFTFGLILNSAEIALLIPPSVIMIVYGVITGTSIGKLYMAGIVPGVILCILFCAYSVIYSRVKKIGYTEQKASWQERKESVKEGIWVFGYPVIIIGGIYAGIFSPTEAAAAAILYAVLVEWLVYRALSIKAIFNAALATGVVTGVVFILVGAGQVASWLISFLKLPDKILPALLGTQPSYLEVIIAINLAYLVACMLVDGLVAMYILTPIFAKYVAMTGIDPVLLGIIVTTQVAMGTVTPPFGCDIFTAQVIFRRPYVEIISHLLPFILMTLLMIVLIVMFPQLCLFLPNAMLGGN